MANWQGIFHWLFIGPVNLECVVKEKEKKQEVLFKVGNFSSIINQIRRYVKPLSNIGKHIHYTLWMRDIFGFLPGELFAWFQPLNCGWTNWGHTWNYRNSLPILKNGNAPRDRKFINRGLVIDQTTILPTSIYARFVFTRSCFFPNKKREFWLGVLSNHRDSKHWGQN